MRNVLMVAAVVGLLAGAFGCTTGGGGGGKTVATAGGEKTGGLPAGVPVADKGAVVPVKMATSAIKADGALDEAAWAAAACLGDFVMTNGNKVPVGTRALVTYDKGNLYIAVVCDEPSTDKLKVDIKDKGGNVWEDDCVEVYVDPSNKKEGPRGEYFGFFINPKNVVYDRTADGNWDGEWTSGTSVIAGKAWIVELAIPWKTMGVTPKAGHKLGLMVARDRIAGGRGQGLYLVPCDDEAKDSNKYPVLELK